MSIAPKKPQAFSHMLWFFLLPVLIFIGWASFKLLGVVREERVELSLFERIEKIEKSRSPGDRWQAAYNLAQALQVKIQSGLFESEFSFEEREDIFGQLGALLETHAKDERLRKYLLLTVGQLKDPLGLTLLEEGFNDEDDEIRFFSSWGYVDILISNPPARTEQRLARVLLWESDTDPARRKLLASALVQLFPKRDQVADLLDRLLNDSDQEVRWNTAVALASVGSDRGAAQLKEMFDLKSLRSLGFNSTRDLSTFVATAYQAAQELGDPEVLKKAEELRRQARDDTPEGRAIQKAF